MAINPVTGQPFPGQTLPNNTPDPSAGLVEQRYNEGESEKDRRLKEQTEAWQEQIAALNAQAAEVREKAATLGAAVRKNYYGSIRNLSAKNAGLSRIVQDEKSLALIKDETPLDPQGSPVAMSAFRARAPYRSAAAIAAIKPRREVSPASPAVQARQATAGIEDPLSAPIPERAPASDSDFYNTSSSNGFLSHLEGVRFISQNLMDTYQIREEVGGSYRGENIDKIAETLEQRLQKYRVPRPQIMDVVQASFVEDKQFEDQLGRNIETLNADTDQGRSARAALASFIPGVDHQKIRTQPEQLKTKTPQIIEQVEAAMKDNQLAFQGRIVDEIAAKAEVDMEQVTKLEREAEKLANKASELESSPPEREPASPKPEDQGGQGGQQQPSGGGGGPGGGGGGEGQGGGGSGGTGGGIPFGSGPSSFQGPGAPRDAVANPTAANKQDYSGLSKFDGGVQDPVIPPFQPVNRVQTAQTSGRRPLNGNGNPFPNGEKGALGSIGPLASSLGAFPGGGGAGNGFSPTGGGAPAGGTGFTGDPFRVGPSYGGRGAGLKKPITVAYGSGGGANSGGDSGGSINTGGGVDPKLANQLRAPQRITSGQPRGVFGLFGELALIEKICRNPEQRGKVRLCRKARGYTMSMAEPKTKQAPASAPGITRSTPTRGIASKDL